MLKTLSKLSLVLCILGLSACQTTLVPRGYVSGDPCIRCGEDFEFTPNETNAAINMAERMGFDWRTSK